MMRAFPKPLRNFLRRPLAVFGLLLVLLMLAGAIFAPALSPHPPTKADFGAILQAPSAAHPLGTDELGRDVLSRLLFGARASLQAGMLAFGGGVGAALELDDVDLVTLSLQVLLGALDAAPGALVERAVELAAGVVDDA